MVEREDVHAAIEARRELGEELEPQVIDSFVERIEKRIGELGRSPAKREPRPGALVLALISLFAGDDRRLGRNRARQPRVRPLTRRASAAAAAGSARTMPAMIAAQPPQPRAPRRSCASV